MDPEGVQHGRIMGSMLSMSVSLVYMQTGRPGTLHKVGVALVVEGGHEALAESQAVKSWVCCGFHDAGYR